MGHFTRESFDRFSQRVARICADALAPISQQDASDGTPDYFCTAWRIDRRESRELFVEVPGDAEYPDRLRVGLYFRDSATVTKRRSIRQSLVRQLADESRRLRPLGLQLTSSARGWDAREFPWTKAGIREWLVTPGHKDVVRLWNLRGGLPSPDKPARVLSALAPLWRQFNGSGRWSRIGAVDEGARTHIVRELAIRDPSLVHNARRVYGTKCAVCRFDFEDAYGPLGHGFVEVHHKMPIARGRRKTHLKDVACVCANCHRMLHRGRTILSIERLRRIVSARRGLKSASPK